MLAMHTLMTLLFVHLSLEEYEVQVLVIEAGEKTLKENITTSPLVMEQMTHH